MQRKRRSVFFGILLWWSVSGVEFSHAVQPPSNKIAPLTERLQPPASAFLNDPEPPPVRFTDITAASGIRFRHINGAAGEKLLPETMGGGCAFLDFDADGDQDIFLVNSAPWSHSGQAASSMLLANDGKGAFKDVTPGSGLEAPLYGMGVAVGDYDNDGLTDVFISAVGANQLFRNLGKGRFENVTQSSGISSPSNQWSSSSAFLDYNNDGRLDLFVCNYVKWSREIDLAAGKKAEGARVYAPPFDFEGAHPLLYRNEGDGRFTEVSAPAGLRIMDARTGQPAGKALGVAPVDLDGDGWMDLIVANDTTANLVFHNLRNGSFREIGMSSGLAYDAFGNVRGAMGIDTAWFRDDASLGVAIANFANEMNTFYVARPGSLHFADEAPFQAIGPASRELLKFGLFFFDYDLDGWPDLLTCNGHLDADIGQRQRGYAQPAQLFWNGGPHQASAFVPVSAEHAGPDLFKPIVGRGAAFADIDEDGDLDVLLTQIGGSPLLLRNDQNTGHRSLRVTLAGTRSNRNAIGARLTLRGANRIWQAHVMPARSYLSQSELPVTFGFGIDQPPAEMEIRWPGGKLQKISVPPDARVLSVQEPE